MNDLPSRVIVGSVLHGAYGDLYEQALCLKHYAQSHANVEMRLFAASEIRLEAFQAVDLSFAASFLYWTEIERQIEIAFFLQFQIFDTELNTDVLEKLSTKCLAKFDRTKNILPWVYMRQHSLIPAKSEAALGLSDMGRLALPKLEQFCGIKPEVWSKPTISFLWRYRSGPGAISAKGQKSESYLVQEYSAMFKRLIERFNAHVFVFGMNIVTTDANRALTDSKYPSFGLDLPADAVTYMPGASWPLELELSTRATVCCGHASGFTEAQWIKRGRGMVLLDPPPHYVAKLIFHRMPLFGLSNFSLISALIGPSSTKRTEDRISELLQETTTS